MFPGLSVAYDVAARAELQLAQERAAAERAVTDAMRWRAIRSANGKAGRLDFACTPQQWRAFYDASIRRQLQGGAP